MDTGNLRSDSKVFSVYDLKRTVSGLKFLLLLLKIVYMMLKINYNQNIENIVKRRGYETEWNFTK